MRSIHPLILIIIGLLIVSIGLNICLLESNKKLVYRLQKLEAGQARGLFIEKNETMKPQLSDEEINELLKQMLKQMINDRIT